MYKYIYIDFALKCESAVDKHNSGPEVDKAWTHMH